MASAPTTDVGKPDLTWGTYGQGLLSDWWESTPDLIWPQSVITYGRMRTDPQLKAVLAAHVLPITRATWVIDPDGCKSEVVQRVADGLGVGVLGDEKGQGAARRRGVIWNRHLRQVMNYLVYGHAPFERRYAQQKDGFMQLDHLGERPPWTISYMNIGPDGIVQSVEQNTQRDPITASRLAWYVNELYGANWTGMSLLRPAFGAWLLKHEGWRVNATSIRRFGMGVPQVEAPPGASQAQLQQAQLLAAQMRAGDQSGIGLPAGYKASLMGVTGSIPDGLGWIKYLDIVMAKMALVQFLELGQTETGSRALGESFMDLFLLSLQSIADEIAVTATSGHDGMPGIITDLVDQNWTDEAAPRLVCTDVGQNYDLSAAALQALVMCGAITPDAGLDDWARKTWRLPKRTSPWQPSSRGIPAGDAISPRVESQLKGEGQTGGQPGADKGVPGQQPPPVAAAAKVKPWYVEASQWDPERHQADWEEALAHLLLQYRNVFSAQRTNLVDQVITALQAGDTGKLALSVPVAAGAQPMVQEAMMSVALRAAQELITEAAAQGVHIDLGQVRLDADALGGIATARTQVWSSYLAQQASSKALQVAGPRPEDFLSAADEVDRFLATLSEKSLRDQLGAALTAAQNAGRFAVLEAAPEAGGHVTYVAAEWLDDNTCDHCRRENGTEFDTLEAATAAYPTGGYKDCEGLMRCRGTVVAVWGDETTTLGGGGAPGPKVAARFNPLEHRGEHGRWERTGGGLAEVARNESGRLAQQTPSRFTHPDTGHAMGKTEIGDTFEALFQEHGAKLLTDKYGGPYRLISGGGGPRNTPLDFALDHSRAGELKTLNKGAVNQKTAIKKEEADRKEAAAKAAGMKPLLVVQVVDPATGRAEVYAFDAFASKTVKAMEHLGGYDFTLADFTAAQESTGHWAKRHARAKEQGLVQ